MSESKTSGKQSTTTSYLLHVKVKRVLFWIRFQANNCVAKRRVGVQEMGPGQNYGRVHLALGDHKHAVSDHVAEGLIFTKARIRWFGLGPHKDVLAGDESVAWQSRGGHLLVEPHWKGLAQLIVEEPQRLRLKEISYTIFRWGIDQETHIASIHIINV